MASLTDLREVDLDILLDFAKRYAKLGWAVQEQFDDLVKDVGSEVNPHAVELMQRELGRFNNELDALFMSVEDEQDLRPSGHDHGEDDVDNIGDMIEN